MAYESELVLDVEAERVFGKYLKTFHSEQGQVVVHLFRKGDWLIAHATTTGGLEWDQVTDPYLEELRRYARENGFEGKLRIVYSR